MANNRRAPFLILLTAVVAVALCSAAPSAAEDRVHTVVKGDTLWDISSAYLYDPFLWPKVWSANRGIENPHLIYPGQEITIPMELLNVGKRIAVARPELPAPPPEPEKVEVTPAPPEEAPPEPMPEEVRQELIKAMSTYGFIIDDNEIGIGTITSMEEERLLISQGEKVYVTTDEDTPLETGEKYSIVRVFNKITHPVTGKKVGYLARVLGDLTVVASKAGLSTAVVGDVYRDVQLKDHVIEHIQYLQWLPKEDNSLPSDLTGYIVANPEGKKILGNADIAFLDLGSADGLHTGDRLDILFEKGKVAGKETPPEVIGQVQVVVPRAENSVVRLVAVTREITPGAKVVPSLD